MNEWINSREKAFNKISSKISECDSRGVVKTKRPGVRKVRSSIPGRTCFFFFFLLSLFFFFSFTFSLHFSFGSFLLFLYMAYVFFRFINFLPYCFTSLSTSCRSPESFARSCDSRISSWKVCFTQCTVFFPKSLFSIADLLPRVSCGSYVTEINSVLWHSPSRHSRPCLLIATLNQQNRFSRCPSNKIRQLISLKMED